MLSRDLTAAQVRVTNAMERSHRRSQTHETIAAVEERNSERTARTWMCHRVPPTPATRKPYSRELSNLLTKTAEVSRRVTMGMFENGSVLAVPL